MHNGPSYAITLVHIMPSTHAFRIPAVETPCHTPTTDGNHILLTLTTLFKEETAKQRIALSTCIGSHVCQRCSQTRARGTVMQGTEVTEHRDGPDPKPLAHLTQYLHTAPGSRWLATQRQTRAFVCLAQSDPHPVLRSLRHNRTTRNSGRFFFFHVSRAQIGSFTAQPLQPVSRPRLEGPALETELAGLRRSIGSSSRSDLPSTKTREARRTTATPNKRKVLEAEWPRCKNCVSFDSPVAVAFFVRHTNPRVATPSTKVCLE